MKQLFIVTNATYANGASTGKDVHSLANGAILAVKLSDMSKLTIAISEDFALYCGRTGLVPRCIPEINYKTLKVVKSAYNSGTMAGVNEVITITPTVSSIMDGDVYTIILSKLGVGFNERNNFTVEYVAKATDSVADVVAGLKKAVADKGLPFTAGSGTSAVVLTATDYQGWDIHTANDFQGTAVVTTAAEAPIQDTAWVADLARQCAAGKGFNYLSDEGKDIYPGFPENIPANATFTIYTLRFAVPRASAKTRDEVVSQLVHIAVPTTSTDLISSLDTLFGTGA